jgi:hypothetical protein
MPTPADPMAQLLAAVLAYRPPQRRLARLQGVVWGDPLTDRLKRSVPIGGDDRSAMQRFAMISTLRMLLP